MAAHKRPILRGESKQADYRDSGLGRAGLLAGVDSEFENSKLAAK